MRILGIAAAGLLVAGPAFAQTGSSLAGAPPSPYTASAGAAGQMGAPPQASANANTFGIPASSTSSSALGGVLQTFDNIGAVRADGSASATTPAPRTGDLMGAETSAATGVKPAKLAPKPH